MDRQDPIAERITPDNATEGNFASCPTIFDIPQYMESLERTKKYLVHMMMVLVQKMELMKKYDRTLKYDSLYREIEVNRLMWNMCMASNSLQVVQENQATLETCMDRLNKAIFEDFTHNLSVDRQMCTSGEQDLYYVNQIATIPETTL